MPSMQRIGFASINHIRSMLQSVSLNHVFFNGAHLLDEVLRPRIRFSSLDLYLIFAESMLFIRITRASALDFHCSCVSRFGKLLLDVIVIM